jgi:hypothetical protein
MFVGVESERIDVYNGRGVEIGKCIRVAGIRATP